MIESTSIVVLQVALRSVLFVPVNVAGQMPAGRAGPFTGTVFECYYRLVKRIQKFVFNTDSASSVHSVVGVLVGALPFLLIGVGYPNYPDI